jgi:phosphoglucosamine mutase
MSKLPQKMVNVRVAERFDPLARSEIVDAIREAEAQLGESGRVLLRPSGTEPLIRVMAEGQVESEIVRVVEDLARIVERSCS